MDVIGPITLFCPQGDGFFVFIYCVSVFTHSRTTHRVLEDSALSVGVGGSRVSSRQSWTPPGSPGEQSDVETSDFCTTCQSSEIGVYGVSREPQVSPLCCYCKSAWDSVKLVSLSESGCGGESLSVTF